MLYFLGDPHFGHHNIIRYSKRPFLKNPDKGFVRFNEDTDRMDSTIINNINQRVTSDDTLILVGDIIWRKDLEYGRKILESINTNNLILVPGNHDEQTLKLKDCFSRIERDMYFKVKDKTVPSNQQAIHIYHYPVLSWRNRSPKKDRNGNIVYNGAWHIHGHTHGHMINSEKWKWYYDQSVIDVSCEVLDYKPISYLDIKNYFKNRNNLFISE